MMSEQEQTDEPEQSSKKRKADWFEIDDERNTYVYISGLPKSITEQEFIELMTRYGVIAFAKRNHSMRGEQKYNIKLYKNQDGSLKGDGLCCYARKESVDLALRILDEYNYQHDGVDHVLHCERAKFQMKGEYDPSLKPRTLDKKAKTKQKQAIDKLLSWEPKAASEVKQKKVILKNMFSPEEILEDATLLLELKQDVEEKCIEIGFEPKRVDIYDRHPDGVIAVTLSETDQAEKLMQALDNEYYAKRLIRAELWDGKTKYKIKETDEESQKRLEKWHEDLQKSDDEGDDKNLDQTKKDSEE